MTALLASFLLVAPAIENIEELSLDELLNPTAVTVSRTDLKLSDAPGVVTVISRDEIEASGAQYLMDLLQFVPGFQFGVDVAGVVGVGFRGVWGHEGKVLVMIDGLEMNETLYGTTQFGNHYPLALAERVEIIRGPGSALYGGFAELAVINIITRTGRQLRGASVQAFYGQWQRAPGRGNLSISAGNAWGDLDVSVHANIGAGLRSDGLLTDPTGAQLDLRDTSALSNSLVEVTARYKGLTLRALNDQYLVNVQHTYGNIDPFISRQRFATWLAEARYDLAVSPSFVLTPRAVFKQQAPWNETNVASLVHYEKSVMRMIGGVGLGWSIVDGLDLTAGIEGYFDHAQVLGVVDDINSLFAGDQRQVSYANGIAYAQLVWLNRWVNVTGGVRVEYHSAFGPSVVPRVAVTRSIDRFNFKLLFSQAFRQPTIENLRVNPALLPERANIGEAEASMRITNTQQVVVNGFIGRIDRTIQYGVSDAADADQYFNAGRTGSSGVEFEYRVKESWANLRLSYSFYVGANAASLLGLATHKVALVSSVDVYGGHLWLDTTGTFLSARDGEFGVVPETFIFNAGLRLRNLPQGVEIAAGVANIADQRYVLLQPYAGGHPPLPTSGREVYLRARFETN